MYTVAAVYMQKLMTRARPGGVSCHEPYTDAKRNGAVLKISGLPIKNFRKDVNNFFDGGWIVNPE